MNRELVSPIAILTPSLLKINYFLGMKYTRPFLRAAFSSHGILCRRGGGRGAGLPGRGSDCGRVAGGASQPFHGHGLTPRRLYPDVSMGIKSL